MIERKRKEEEHQQRINRIREERKREFDRLINIGAIFDIRRNNNIVQNYEIQDEEINSNEKDEDKINEDNQDIFIENNENVDDIKDIINQLPVNTLKDVNKLNEENKRCVICYENFKNNDNIIYLPCFHFFHQNCIINWIKKKPSCPLCKIKINNNSLSKFQ
jgi:hypothetical protein